MTPRVVWGSPEWAMAAAALLAIATAFVLWNYVRAGANRRTRVVCALLKATAITALVLSLLEPLFTGTRPQRGANAFVIAADNSRSLSIRDAADSPTRGEWMQDVLRKDSAWQTRLGQDFDARRYLFDTHLRSVEDFGSLTFEGSGSAVGTSLSSLSRRFRGLPLAGILLLSDGNRTDAEEIDFAALPPVYAVLPPSQSAPKDIRVANVAVSQTNFEAAPVVLRAEVLAEGYDGEQIVAVVQDENGAEVERQVATCEEDGKPLGFRFQFRAEKKGVSFYTVSASAAAEEADPAARSREQTQANNSRLTVVDQGGGPYRVLYVGGRPNWEFKFLRRAIDADEQLRLVGLLRIARRQPKFDFQREGTRTQSPLYEGFDNVDEDTGESYDEPVLVRLGTEDEAELRAGFPKAAEELYRYHAVVIDDLEAAFFTPDQHALLRDFVSIRGGGLLMLGGPETFSEGEYDRTSIGDLLPVYLNRGDSRVPMVGEHRLALTREGWLQPWVRTRKTEEEERRRLGGMPSFQTLSSARGIKPGAIVLAEVRDAAGEATPALVAQQFGRGAVGAVMIGDLWRWRLKRSNETEDDFDRAWRQTVRWLVADVPERVEAEVRPGDAAATVRVTVRVRDAEYRPLDNAVVAIHVHSPGGESLALEAQPDASEAGSYSLSYAMKTEGAYRFHAVATAADGSAVGAAEAGWAAQPSADEFARLEPDRDFLKRVADATGGEVIEADDLDDFVTSLAFRDAPITEPWSSPIWHHPLYFLAALLCLTAEWGLRRVNGLR